LEKLTENNLEISSCINYFSVMEKLISFSLTFFSLIRVLKKNSIETLGQGVKSRSKQRKLSATWTRYQMVFFSKLPRVEIQVCLWQLGPRIDYCNIRLKKVQTTSYLFWYFYWETLITLSV